MSKIATYKPEHSASWIGQMLEAGYYKQAIPLIAPGNATTQNLNLAIQQMLAPYQDAAQLVFTALVEKGAKADRKTAGLLWKYCGFNKDKLIKMYGAVISEGLLKEFITSKPQEKTTKLLNSFVEERWSNDAALDDAAFLLETGVAPDDNTIWNAAAHYYHGQRDIDFLQQVIRSADKELLSRHAENFKEMASTRLKGGKEFSKTSDETSIMNWCLSNGEHGEAFIRYKMGAHPNGQSLTLVLERKNQHLAYEFLNFGLKDKPKLSVTPEHLNLAKKMGEGGIISIIEMRQQEQKLQEQKWSSRVSSSTSIMRRDSVISQQGGMPPTL